MSEEKIKSAWRTIYDTPHGREAIAWLMAEAGVYDVQAPSNEMHAGIMIGERNIAVKVAAMCGRAPEVVVEETREDTDLLKSMANMKHGD